MVGRLCSKCGSSSQEDTSLTFHRFPVATVKCSLKTKVWAVYTFPHEDWTEYQSLCQLYKSHKMLCSKHFDDSSYTSSARKRLNKFAIPTEARDILAKLRDQENHRGELLINDDSRKTTADMDDKVKLNLPDAMEPVDDPLPDEDEDPDGDDVKEQIQKCMEPRNHLQSSKIQEYKSIIERKYKKIRRLQAQISHYQEKIIDLEGAAGTEKLKSYANSDHDGIHDLFQKPIYYYD